MASVATPRRTAFTERQPTCIPPAALFVDLVSPCPPKRTTSMLSQASHGTPTRGPHPSRPQQKRGRDKDDVGDGGSSGSKRSRPSTGTPRPGRPTQIDAVRAGPPVEDEDSTPTVPRNRPTKAERAERQQQINSFKEKYTRVFPSFVFHFHGLDANLRKTLTTKVQMLGSRVDDFFSAHVTHVITNRERPVPGETERLKHDKENAHAAGAAGLSLVTTAGTGAKSTNATLRSPIQLKGALHGATDGTSSNYDGLVVKAIQLQMKIWDSQKLESILSRLLPTPTKSRPKAVASQSSYMLPPPSRLKAKAGPSKSNLTLSKLLQTEKKMGVTSERDPNAPRPDFEYFPRNSYFLMVHDCDQKYVPVAIKNYGRWKIGEKPTWPVLNLDSLGFSNPNKAPVFGWKPEVAQIPVTRASSSVPKADAALKKPDLRKTASMNNIGRKRLSLDYAESVRANPSDKSLVSSSRLAASRPSMGSAMSGTSNLASQGYAAASGNSAYITSNIASTTSAAPFIRPDGTAKLSTSTAIGKRLHQQVLTTRTFAKPTVPSPEDSVVAEITDSVTSRPHVLKKSKSMNTMRLPPREESKKPGYCENCKKKFEDYDKHVSGKTHQTYADGVEHFAGLDDTLARVRRKTRQAQLREAKLLALLESSQPDSDSDTGSSDEDEEHQAQHDGYDWSDQSSTAKNDYDGQSTSQDDMDDVEEDDELALKVGDSETGYARRYSRSEDHTMLFEDEYDPLGFS